MLSASSMGASSLGMAASVLLCCGVGFGPVELLAGACAGCVCAAGACGAVVAGVVVAVVIDVVVDGGLVWSCRGLAGLPIGPVGGNPGDCHVARASVSFAVSERCGCMAMVVMLRRRHV